MIKLLDNMHKYKTMLSYCLKRRKNTKNRNPKISETSDGRTMILSNCNICGSKKWKFINKQEANGLLSSLGIKTPLSKISLVGPSFVLNVISLNSHYNNSKKWMKQFNKFLLAGDKFMSKMHLNGIYL